MIPNLDKSAWKRVALRDVVRHITDRVDAETSGLERFLAGEHIPSGNLAITDWGIIGRDPIGPMFYKRFQPGHVLYVSRRTYLRKVAVPEFEGITGEKTFVLETLDRTILLQEFLPFVLSAEHFHTYAIANSRGSVNPYLNWGELAAYEFDLPPLDEQKRIADLLWAVEHHRLSLVRSRQDASQVLRQFLHQCYTGASGPKHAIADLCTEVVGGVWGSPEGENEVDVLALGPRVYAPGTTGFVTDDSPVRSITKRQAATRIVKMNDIILERSGGSPDQPVGRVVIAGAGLEPCIPTDFQRLLRPNRDLVEPRYLFWQLKYDWMTGRTLDYSRRTTNITNLSVKDYLARTLQVPSRDYQLRVLAEVDRLETALASIDGETSALTAVRSSLLTDIFRGQ
jgi:type I restriction enzyme, S subunit